MFWGKILGAIFGFLVAGPIGALIGFIVGHNFDRGLELHRKLSGYTRPGSGSLAKAQYTFFKATFTVMGHVAKADGRISENEIRLARSIMDRMGLDDRLKRQAMLYFDEGKQPNFNLLGMLDNLRRVCQEQRVLLKLFIDIQIAAANADGWLDDRTRFLLHKICSVLGFNLMDFMGYANENDYKKQYQESHQQHKTQPPKVDALKKAYAVLEVSENASDADIKSAYRRLMSHNHPDKLVARGLPEEMMRLATEKTQQISAAYELIRKMRANARA